MRSDVYEIQLETKALSVKSPGWGGGILHADKTKAHILLSESFQLQSGLELSLLC